MTGAPKREFITKGERLIDCTLHCPANELKEKNPEYVKVSRLEGVTSTEPYRQVPICIARGAPSIEHNVSKQKIPPLLHKARGCVHHAKLTGIELSEN